METVDAGIDMSSSRRVCVEGIMNDKGVSISSQFALNFPSFSLFESHTLGNLLGLGQPGQLVTCDEDGDTWTPWCGVHPWSCPNGIESQ